MKGKRLLSVTMLALSSALSVAVVAAPSASADASGAQYQLQFTANCDNPSICGSQNLGGFRGVAQFNFDGTASAELTNCGHLLGGGPAAGALHYVSDIADLNGQPGWYIGPDGNFFNSNETITFTGRNGGPPVIVFDAFPPYPHDIGIPAAPGHFQAAQLLGFTPPPGFSFEVQVTQFSG